MTDDELIDSLKGFTLGKWAVDGSPGIDGKHDVWVSWDEIICENARPEDAALIAAAPDLHRVALERGAEIARLRRKLAKAVDALGMGLDADNDAHTTGPTQ